jgi:predicted phage tail protein
MNKLVTINLHGAIGKHIGEQYELAVESISEAIGAINTITKNKLFKYLLEKDQRGAKYEVLINESPFISEVPLDNENISLENLNNSELQVKRSDLRTIDIVPVIDGSGGGGGGRGKGVVGVVLGVLLVVVGIVAMGTPFGWASPYLITAGIGLIAAGVVALLTKPPKFEDFQETTNGKNSYLFGGPANTVREGGPIPVGYGRLIVGSQVISTTYVIEKFRVYIT